MALSVSSAVDDWTIGAKLLTPMGVLSVEFIKGEDMEMSLCELLGVDMLKCRTIRFQGADGFKLPLREFVYTV